MNDVLLIGAPGYLGQYVAREFAAGGYDVHGVATRASVDPGLDDVLAHYVPANLHNQIDRMRLADYIRDNGISGIVFAAGSVDYDMNLVEALNHHAGLAQGLGELLDLSDFQGRTVYTGSVMEHGVTDEKTQFTEATDPTTDVALTYAYAKANATQQILVQTSDHFDVVVVKPGSLVGPGYPDTTTTTEGLIHQFTRLPVVLTGGAPYVSTVKAAEAIRLAYEIGRPGEQYLIGGENASMKELYGLVAQELGLRNPIVLPKPVAALMGKIGWKMNEVQAFLGSRWSAIDDTKAREELGYIHSEEDLMRAIRDVLGHMEA